MLEALHLKEAFDIIILAGEEVRQCSLGGFPHEQLRTRRAAAKPDPTPYKVALEKLGVNPQQAIAIEDSASGISSAITAGIRTFGMASTQTPKALKQFGAFMAISDFTDLQLWTFLDAEINTAM